MSFPNLPKTFRYVNEMGEEIIFEWKYGFLIEKPKGIDTLSIRHSEAQGINQVGSTFQSSNVQSRPVTVSGRIVGAFQDQMKTRLLSVVRPDLSAKLYADDYYLDVRPSATPTIEGREHNANFQFSVLAAYPYWQKDSSATATLSGVRKAFKFPWNISGGGTVYSDSGSMVSFNATESTPLIGVAADIEPVQDLHGYDAPWAGGAGKNKAQLSNDNVGSNQRSTVAYGASGATITATGTYGRYGWLIPVTIGETYTISMVVQASNENGSGYNMRVYLGSADGVWSSSNPDYIESFTSTTTDPENRTLTFTASTATLFVGAYVTTTATDGSLTISSLQLEQGSTATAYEPYSNICPISGWSNVNVYREAQYDAGATPSVTVDLGGTRYGGTLDVTTGVLSVDKAKFVIDATNTYYKAVTGSNRLQVNISEIKPSTEAMSDKFQYSQGSSATGTFYVSTSMSRVFFNSPTDTVFTTLTEWNSWLTDNPITIIAELATPQTIQLTGQTLPSTLVGANSVWADTGDVSVRYKKKVGTPYRFGEVVTAAFINVYNEGQVPVPFTVTLSAIDTVVNPKLIEADTNEYLLLNKTLVAGEKVVIQITHDRTYVNSSIDGECRGALDLGSSFFRLKVGDNVIKPEATSGKANLNVEIDFASEIVGIAL